MSERDVIVVLNVIACVLLAGVVVQSARLRSRLKMLERMRREKR